MIFSDDLGYLREWTPKRAQQAEQATLSYLGTFRVRDGDWTVRTVGRRPSDREIIEERERRLAEMRARERSWWLKLA